MSEESNSVESCAENKSGCFKTGCLISTVILVVAIIWTIFNFKSCAYGLAASVVEIGAEKIYEGMGLPPEEVQKMMKPIKKVTEKIRNGDLTEKQISSIMEKIAENQEIPLALSVKVLENNYLDASSLSPEEKADIQISAKRTRFGLVNKLISPEKLSPLKDIIVVESLDSVDGKEEKQYTLKEKLTDDEIRQCALILKEASNIEAITNDVKDPDLSLELKKIIDEALEENTTEDAVEN